MLEYYKQCQYCGQNFIAHRKDKKFCSTKCRDDFNHQKTKYKIKAAERARRWYQNNKEYANNRRKEYIKLHPEQRKETNRKYFETHKEEELAQRDQYLRSKSSFEEYDNYAICHFNGISTIVDLEDLERIKTKSWYLINDRYPYFKSYDLTTKLHRFIMHCNDPALDVHHIDNNQFNNRKINLIILTHSQHSQLHRYQDKIRRQLSREEILIFFNNKEDSLMKSTEIIFVIDKSGSMAHLAGDTIGGFNGFIESQKALDGKATLTTVLFDTTWKTLHDGVDIHEVKPMTSADYSAYGGTAMLDAIGETIERVQNRHDELSAEKPDNVLFVITTDGEENSSHKFKKSQIEKMIKHQTNGHGWKFMFLGANMDAVKEANNIGISSDYAVNYTYTPRGVNAVYDTLSYTASAVRCDSLSDDFNLKSAYTEAETASMADLNITQ